MTSALAPLFRDGDLETFSRDVLLALGADEPTAAAATRAMMHASRIGVDSHGVRLLPHYAAVLSGGRVNRAPDLRFSSSRAAIATLHADHAHGASRPADGGEVMAPGDREWREAERRAERGIPVDAQTVSAFGALADRYRVAAPLAS